MFSSWSAGEDSWGSLGQDALDNKEIKPHNPKGNQPWISIWRTDAGAPILWHLMGAIETAPISHPLSWLIGTDPDAEEDWGQVEKGATEDLMVGWHHRHNGHGFEQTMGDNGGQGSLACCSPWGGKGLDMIQWLSKSKCRLSRKLKHIAFSGITWLGNACPLFRKTSHRGYQRRQM